MTCFGKMEPRWRSASNGTLDGLRLAMRVTLFIDMMNGEDTSDITAVLAWNVMESIDVFLFGRSYDYDHYHLSQRPSFEPSLVQRLRIFALVQSTCLSHSTVEDASAHISCHGHKKHQSV